MDSNQPRSEKKSWTIRAVAVPTVVVPAVAIPQAIVVPQAREQGSSSVAANSDGTTFQMITASAITTTAMDEDKDNPMKLTILQRKEVDRTVRNKAKIRVPIPSDED